MIGCKKFNFAYFALLNLRTQQRNKTGSFELERRTRSRQKRVTTEGELPGWIAARVSRRGLSNQLRAPHNFVTYPGPSSVAKKCGSLGSREAGGNLYRFAN